MKEKQITVSIETAMDWYNSSIPQLKELALSIFPEEELNEIWKQVTTFEDALRICNLDAKGDVTDDLEIIEHNFPFNHKQILNFYKLFIVHRALNGDTWNPFETEIYVPLVHIFNDIDSCNRFVKGEDSYNVVPIDDDDTIFYLVGGDCYQQNDIFKSGDCIFSMANICCKSEKIARHFSTYFPDLLYNVYYGKTVNTIWTLKKENNDKC
jgi:hypothetical protein